jgi:multidrug efflux pump subunit AcrA (membrane-fusion protein)
MSWFSSFSSPFKPTDPVAAAQTKVDSAQAALTKAKEEVTRLEGELSSANTELSQAKNTVPLANTADGVRGGRKRTYRNKEKRPAKRRRNGRRSIRS